MLILFASPEPLSTPVSLALCPETGLCRVYLQGSFAYWLLTELSQTGYTRCMQDGGKQETVSIFSPQLPPCPAAARPQL